jgi:hypothetical protein
MLVQGHHDAEAGHCDLKGAYQFNGSHRGGAACKGDWLQGETKRAHISSRATLQTRELFWVATETLYGRKNNRIVPAESPGSNLDPAKQKEKR